MPESEPTMHQTETGAVRSCEYSGGIGRPEKNRLDLLLKNREAMETLAEAFGRGMKKYGRDNWMKGFKESVLVQHAFDHLLHYVNGTCDPGEEDVDQLSGVLWNIGTLCWTRKHKPELLDLTGPDPGPENTPMGWGCTFSGNTAAQPEEEKPMPTKFFGKIPLEALDQHFPGIAEFVRLHG